MKEERTGEYIIRLGLAVLVALLGAFIVFDSISRQVNGFQIIVGLELLGGSYFITARKFSGFDMHEGKQQEKEV